MPITINKQHKGLHQMIYVTWNRFDLESIKKAEKKKAMAENKGYTLVHQTSNSLTYKKQSENKQ